MSMPQSSTTMQSAGQVSMPIQTSAPSGSSLPMNTAPHISAIDSYSTVITDQSTGIGRQSNQQQSNAGSSLFGERSSFLGSYGSPDFQTPSFQSPLFQVPVFHNQGQVDQVPPMTLEMMHQRFTAIEHTMAGQVERFENAFPRLINRSANSGGAGSSGSAVTGSNTATGTAHVEVPPVKMVNNPLYNAIFQPSATDTPIQHVGTRSNNNGSQTVANTTRHGMHSWYYPMVPSQPAFIPPPRNFTFDGHQLPPLSSQYDAPVMMFGTPWGQHMPYQGYQVP
ncbi:OLC1v1005691C1 [Oldenlandia corymbosa var. corymbosa]|uniref:OLC1v1005691C1 n=1 Tax=Oldenlandia corymbosa var. corymbosa TaxID=529605 RepID=A0AAV1DHW1_OLDCO|nr:OLC1v1005691C1 [Oldenlandia corymbosa var. corymbosa]